MYKRYTLKTVHPEGVISGTYIRPKVYQILGHLGPPAASTLYPIAPDRKAALMIYAPPACGKSTFMANLHKRFCACEISSFLSDVQFINHEYHIVDTDYCVFDHGNIVITNTYHLMCRAEKTVAILPSESQMASRYELRNLVLKHEEYVRVYDLCKRFDIFIQSDDYVDNLLSFTEL